MEEHVEPKPPPGPEPKETVKSEGLAPSPDASELSDGAASPPPNCSICLGKLINTSFTDSCLHQFCFTCLLQWSKIKTECPLCKQTFKSIIHNVRSEEDYDQYHVPRDLAPQLPATPQVAATLDLNFNLSRGNFDVGFRRFFYRTTMIPNRRLGVVLNPEQVARREQLPSLLPEVPRVEQRRRRANPLAFRRSVYVNGIWASPLPDIFGRFRECSAQHYRRIPNELHRLVPWLNRDLQVLLNNNAVHVAYAMRLIMDALTQHEIRSPEFRDIVRPFCGFNTEHFVHELSVFARANFDLVGYDQSVTYINGQGLSNSYVSHVNTPISSTSSSSSSSADDSDIRILNDDTDSSPRDIQIVNEHLSTQRLDASAVGATLPGVGPHVIDIPGPSTVNQVLLMRTGAPFAGRSGVPDVLTISSNSSSSSDDDCEVVGYIKPRHERTPEIIELLSSATDSDTAAAAGAAPGASASLAGSSRIVTDSPSTSNDLQVTVSLEKKHLYSDSSCSDDGESTKTTSRSKKRKSKRHQEASPGKSARGSGKSRRHRLSSRSLPSTTSDSFESDEEREEANKHLVGSLTVRKDLIDKDKSRHETNGYWRKPQRKCRRNVLSSSASSSASSSERSSSEDIKPGRKCISRKDLPYKKRSRSFSAESSSSRSSRSSRCSSSSPKRKAVSSRRRRRGTHHQRNSSQESTQFRSHSQCSDRGMTKSRKKSKHREKHKDKDKDKDKDKNTPVVGTAVCKNDTKHSESDNKESVVREKKRHKRRRESKHRKSRTESKSKSKKRKKRSKCILSTSSSD